MKYLLKYKYIILIIVSVFFISANIAWLNPRPDFVIKTHEKIPLLWQYNVDSSHEFMSGAYFPEYYKQNNIRINRPTYALATCAIGETVGFIMSPIIKLNILAKGIIGYITIKFIFYLIGAICLYEIIKKYLGELIALLSVIITFFHPHSIYFATTFNSSELQFIIPIIIIYLFLNISKKYSLKKNILYSLLLGIIMLAKQTYAIYLAILLYSFFYKKKYKESVLSGLIHLVPLLLWLFYIKISGLTYWNNEVQAYGMGVWLFNELPFMHPIEIIQTIMQSIVDWLIVLTKYFNIFLLLAPFAFFNEKIKNIFNKNVTVFSILFIFSTWLQIFASRSYAWYMSSDIAILVFPLAIFIIYFLLEKFRLKNFTKALVGLYIILSLISFINLPWVHPYNQINKLEGKNEKVNSIKAGNLVK